MAKNGEWTKLNNSTELSSIFYLALVVELERIEGGRTPYFHWAGVMFTGGDGQGAESDKIEGSGQ